MSLAPRDSDSPTLKPTRGRALSRLPRHRLWANPNRQGQVECNGLKSHSTHYIMSDAALPSRQKVGLYVILDN
ncbi:unnamed protein product [Protopolystoma xenopodis]|uniref:Uncharacterized protein n=1 Tax=Protopolystoma xenopodis TaxID=117903 RepID=A0A448WG86_9PLAT|nr:unnamed protein product [Protopolystoma xenopodis]